MALELLDTWIAELEAVVGGNAAIDGEKKKDVKKEPKVKENREKVAKQPPQPTDSTELSVNSLDLRVGLITSCVKHETADKLYCEVIDIGEEEKRPIASGLVKHYSLDQMQNRKVIVIANLSPRKLVGFKSHGMVLCAAKDVDGEEKVEFVEVPQDAPIGSRIVGLGLPISTALTPKQVDKQKVWEVISAGLRSDENGIAYWQNSKLVIEGSENHCFAPTLSGAILR